MTVLEVIQRSSEFLERKGVESPRLQIELLLAHVLHLPRLKLYLNFERRLTDTEMAQVRELVQRRGRREPLQHLVGTAAFCGLELDVDRRVLVPRPETELLAERGWEYLNELETTLPIALDFGTGSGCLAIALAVHCPRARLHATDISTAALAVARGNAARGGVAERITFHAGDGLAVLPPDLRFDLLVSNPPYIPAAELPTLQPEVRDYDPPLALNGGADGLDFYRRLAREASAVLTPGARLMLEFGDGQATALRALFEQQNWIVERIEADYSGRPRILVAGRRAE